MTLFRSNARPLLGLLLVIVAVLGAIFITAATPPRTPTAHVVKLIPVAYRAPSTGGGSIPVPRYFTRALRHHAWCGAPTTRAKRGIHGVFRQYFHRCQMAIGPVKVYGLAAPTPLPESSIIGGLLSGTPTARPQPSNTPPPPVPAPLPRASATPQPYPTPIPVNPTPIPPTALPLPIVGPPSDPALYELYLMNQTRASLDLPAYALDSTQSNGTASCGGSIGHSQDMAASGTIWHVNAAYPQESFPNNFCGSGYRALGENVGMAGGYSVNGALDVIHNSMMQEPHSPGCQGNHACSIISSQYTRVGIGVYTSGGATWLSVDFEG